MTKQRVNLFINTTFLFVASWLSIKLLLIIGKIFVAGIFNIEWIYNGYSIFPISPSNSEVWTYLSVISFFSVDLILLLCIAAVCIVFLFFKKINNKQKEPYLYWVLITTLLVLFSNVISGVLTKTNLYYVLNWLHVSYSIMILTVMPFFFIGIGILTWISYQYLIAVTTKVVSEKINHFYISTYKHLSPVGIIGLLLLYIPVIFTFNKYLYTELVLSIILVIGIGLVKKIKNRQFYDSFTNKVNLLFIAIASVLYCIFIIFRMF